MNERRMGAELGVMVSLAAYHVIETALRRADNPWEVLGPAMVVWVVAGIVLVLFLALDGCVPEDPES